MQNESTKNATYYAFTLQSFPKHLSGYFLCAWFSLLKFLSPLPINYALHASISSYLQACRMCAITVIPRVVFFFICFNWIELILTICLWAIQQIWLTSAANKTACREAKQKSKQGNGLKYKCNFGKFQEPGILNLLETYQKSPSFLKKDDIHLASRNSNSEHESTDFNNER